MRFAQNDLFIGNIWKTQKTMSAHIRLDDLNSDVARKLRKFDTSNDGVIDNKEAIQALITLQKQSDNYKKMIWVLIPVLIIAIGCVFGTTMLAIHLTQQIKITDGSYLTTMNGEPTRVVSSSYEIPQSDFESVAFSSDIVALTDITIREGYNAKVTGVVQNLFVIPAEVHISTQFFTMTIYSNLTKIVTPIQGYETHPMIKAFNIPAINMKFMSTMFATQGKPTSQPSVPPPSGTIDPGKCRKNCPGTGSHNSGRA